MPTQKSKWDRVRAAVNDYLSANGISVRQFARDMEIDHQILWGWISKGKVPKGDSMLELISYILRNSGKLTRSSIIDILES